MANVQGMIVFVVTVFKAQTNILTGLVQVPDFIPKTMEASEKFYQF